MSYSELGFVGSTGQQQQQQLMQPQQQTVVSLSTQQPVQYGQQQHHHQQLTRTSTPVQVGHQFVLFANFLLCFFFLCLPCIFVHNWPGIFIILTTMVKGKRGWGWMAAEGKKIIWRCRERWRKDRRKRWKCILNGVKRIFLGFKLKIFSPRPRLLCSLEVVMVMPEICTIYPCYWFI